MYIILVGLSYQHMCTPHFHSQDSLHQNDLAQHCERKLCPLQPMYSEDPGVNSLLWNRSPCCGTEVRAAVVMISKTMIGAIQ